MSSFSINNNKRLMNLKNVYINLELILLIYLFGSFPRLERPSGKFSLECFNLWIMVIYIEGCYRYIYKISEEKRKKREGREIKNRKN